jgi:hypothetical protein
MAITPNTDFTSGQILTATQQNNFPRGVMSFAQATANVGPFTAETVMVTLPSFTAVANRYYRVTGFFPRQETSGAGNSGNFTVRVRKGTTTAGTEIQFSTAYTDGNSDDFFMAIVWVGTLTAGAQQMVLTFQSGANAIVYASATNPIQFVIEDIGTA